MTNELKPCTHAELCASGCDLADITECEYYSAERTCRTARIETGEPAEYDCDEVTWRCESCHEEIAIYAYNENGDTWADKPAFCPSCGAKVVGE